MKKTLPPIVTALVSLFFAGIVCAAEPAKKAAPPAPAAPAAGEVKKEETRPAGKKALKAKSPRKKGEKKAVPTESPEKK
jgi:hypothetical protein